jgi:hypothetical protein
LGALQQKVGKKRQVRNSKFIRLFISQVGKKLLAVVFGFGIVPLDFLDWRGFWTLPWREGLMSPVPGELDIIEELRLRRWARQNYVSLEQRDSRWHPVILDEMDKKDLESTEPILVREPV